MLHVRHALCCILLTLSAKRRHKMVKVEVLMTTRADNRKSFFLCIHTKTTRANQVKGYFHFLQRDKHGKSHNT